MEAAIATGAAKNMLKKVKWSNQYTWARIVAWVSVFAYLGLGGFIMFGIPFFPCILVGLPHIGVGFIVLFMEVVAAFKCCEATKKCAKPIDFCLSLPTLRGITYIVLSAGLLVLTNFLIFKGTGGMLCLALNIPPVLHLASGILYMIAFCVVDKCQFDCKKGKRGNQNEGKVPLLKSRLEPVAKSDWKPDSSSRECSNCGARFGLIRRKHHCRFCGELVCKDCSADKLLPASGYDEALRCCRKCMMKNQEAVEATSVGGRMKAAGDTMKNAFGKMGSDFKNFGSNFKKIKNPFAKKADDNNNRERNDIESGYGAAKSSAPRSTNPPASRNTTKSPAWAKRNPFARASAPAPEAAAAAAPEPATDSRSDNPFSNGRAKNPFRK